MAGGQPAVSHLYWGLPSAELLCVAPPPLPQAPKLKTVWLEGNPLTPEAVAALLQSLPASSVTALGLDESQLQQLPLAQREALVAAAGPKLRVSTVVPPPGGGTSSSSAAPGYFKLDPAPAAAAAADNGSSRPSTEVLVVSFGSAPGTPNWGGLLKKVRAAATTPQVHRVAGMLRTWEGLAVDLCALACCLEGAVHICTQLQCHTSSCLLLSFLNLQEQNFDVLYVVDPSPVSNLVVTV